VNNNNTFEKWVNFEETANHMGVSKDIARNWIKKGTIPQPESYSNLNH
jgi:predicted site-specific integrase-resolvase